MLIHVGLYVGANCGEIAEICLLLDALKRVNMCGSPSAVCIAKDLAPTCDGSGGTWFCVAHPRSGRVKGTALKSVVDKKSMLERDAEKGGARPQRGLR